MNVGIPSGPPQPPSKPGLHLCTHTWAASTLSSSVHRSILVTCGAHGTPILSAVTPPKRKNKKKKKIKYHHPFA